MVTNKTKKNKKALTTTLGKAPNHNEVINDLSQLLKPIDTSIYGIRQVLAIFQKGTDEVKNYLTFECDILFECRICRSIFRSLANFILHKRNYCQDRFHTVNCFREDDEDLSSVVDKSNDVTDEEVLPEHAEKTGLAVVIEKLKEKQNIKDLSERILKEDLSSESQNNKHEPKKINNNILFEKIASNNAAVFQTVLENLPKKSIIRPDLMKSEVMEIHGILDKNEAVLDEHGKVTEFQTNNLDKNPLIPRHSLVCSECDMKFSTKKTLTYHLKYKHNNSRLVYICPECKDSFANAWSVFRHLLKVHRKTHTQVKRLRHQVHNSVVRRDEEPSRKKQLKQEEKIADDENQWLDNIEGDKDFQMCGGCGKRFERKAALQSHVQMCTKRIAVCNTIKENNAKRKDEESKDSKNKTSRSEDKANSPQKREGASKRKPYSLRTYKPGVDPVVDCVVINDDVENTARKSELPISNCDIEVIPNLEYSDEFNEMNSPIRSISAMTPLLETIDTEKMLSIIGIPEIRLKVSQQKSPEKTSVETAAIDPDPKILPVVIEKVIPQVSQIADDDDVVEIIKTEKSSTTYSASDLDSFCSKNIVTIDITDEDDKLFNTEAIEESSTNMKVEVSTSSRSSQRKTKIRKRKRSSIDLKNTKMFKLSEEFVGSTDLEYIQRAEPYMDQARLKCIPCQVKYETFTELIWHMSAHFSWFRYQCSQCSFISWSRKACRKHAIEAHHVAQDSLNGVVLEIPDWKIGLMTHSFRELLVEDLDLNGRHTDEVIVVSEEEDIVIKEEVIDSSYDDAQYGNNADILFSESDRLESSDDVRCNQSNTRTDSIDVEDGDDDLFIVEVPEEIVPQCSDNIEYYQRVRLESSQLTSKDEFVPVGLVDKEICSDTDSNDMTQPSRNYNVPSPIYEVPELDNIETGQVLESNTYSCNKGESEFILIQPSKDSFTKSLDNLPMVRSTRTRIPSIKTSQVDFLYDLNGVIKMNNSTTNPKQKKIASSSNHVHRNLKESETNPNSKSKVCVNK